MIFMCNIILTIYKEIIFHGKDDINGKDNILINLTDPSTEVLCTSFLFYINLFNLCNLNIECLIAETKMNCVS